MAIAAFDDESKVRRIIDLESGAVRRPHTSTVDPLVVYFDISDEELHSCRGYGLFSKEERTSLGMPRELLENLALRFEIVDPDANDDELMAFLKSKAKELKDLKIRLGKIDGGWESVSAQMRLAESALEGGEFERAEEILAAAEEAQQESQTLKSIEVQVEIRMARADTALMLGNSSEASAHYSRAANYFLGFSISQTSSLLAEGAGRIYEIERRAKRPLFSSALPLAEQALSLTPSNEVPNLFLRSYQFAMLLLSQSRLSRDKLLLNHAEKLINHALSEYGAAVDKYDLHNAKIVLGNIYLQRVEMGGRGAGSALNKALLTYEDCILLATISGQAMQLCHLHNNIATAYRHAAEVGSKAQRASKLQKARDHLREAVKISGENGQPEVWASAQYNLGGSFAEEARLVDKQDAYFYRIQAIAALQSSMEAYPQTAVNWQLARCNLNLGRVLFDHALHSGKNMGEVYLFRSIQHSEIAAAMYGDFPNSEDLAMSHFQIGIAFYVHSEDALPDVALGDLQRAVHSFEKCLSTLGDDLTSGDLKLKCAEALRSTKDAIQELADPNTDD